MVFAGEAGYTRELENLRAGLCQHRGKMDTAPPALSWRGSARTGWNQPVCDSVSQQHLSEKQENPFLARNYKKYSLSVETHTSSCWILHE